MKTLVGVIGSYAVGDRFWGRGKARGDKGVRSPFDLWRQVCGFSTSLLLQRSNGDLTPLQIWCPRRDSLRFAQGKLTGDIG